MITVTDTAAAELRRLLADNEMADAKLRIFVQNECGCGKVNFGMGFDQQVEDNDQVVDSAGVGVVMDQQAFAALGGRFGGVCERGRAPRLHDKWG